MIILKGAQKHDYHIVAHIYDKNPFSPHPSQYFSDEYDPLDKIYDMLDKISLWDVIKTSPKYHVMIPLVFWIC